MVRILLSACVLAAAAASGASAAPGRFLYVLGCDARLARIDTASRTAVRIVDLAATPSGRKLIAQARGTLEGCLVYQAEHDPSASRFYTVAPVEDAPAADGTKDYQVLGVSIPGARVDRVMSAGSSLPDPPHIALASPGPVVATPASAWSPATSLDLTGYGEDAAGQGDRVLESSGDCALLQVFSGSGALTIGVADRKAKTLRLLRGLPATTARDVHLAPDGRFILVEEVGPSDGGPEASGISPTGRLVLFDSATGAATSRLHAPIARGLSFLAISPNGMAIYHRSDAYRLVNLGRASANIPVKRPLPDGPPFFFADR